MPYRTAVRRLVLAAAAAAAATLLGLTAFSVYEISRRDTEIGWVTHTHAVLDELGGARLELKNAELGRRIFRLTGSVAARETARLAGEGVRSKAETLQKLTSDNPPQVAKARRLAAAAAEGTDAEAESLLRAMSDVERELLRERSRRQARSVMLSTGALGSGLLLCALGGALALRLILRGLDERERILADLEERGRALAASNAELEAFNYSVSHDLRAPLRAIDGFTRILAKDQEPRLDDEGRRVLGRIRANAASMGLLIDSLLAFSRLGRQALQYSKVDMETLARRAAVDAAAAEPGRAVRLTIGELPPCRGDAAMLALVWNNLLANAYKYTRPRAEARVEIGGAAVDGAVEYWVKDDGVGFNQRYVGKLFGVFSRLHSSSEFEGTGVGLALARRVLERHGGGIAGAGVVDKGAEFRFTLPAGGRS